MAEASNLQGWLLLTDLIANLDQLEASATSFLAFVGIFVIFLQGPGVGGSLAYSADNTSMKPRKCPKVKKWLSLFKRPLKPLSTCRGNRAYLGRKQLIFGLIFTTNSSHSFVRHEIFGFYYFKKKILNMILSNYFKKVGITFSNFSCRFLNPNNFFQFESQFF